MVYIDSVIARDWSDNNAYKCVGTMVFQKAVQRVYLSSLVSIAARAVCLVLILKVKDLITCFAMHNIALATTCLIPPLVGLLHITNM